MKHYMIGLITLGILSLALTAPSYSYADRITHLSSQKCVHPKGRSISNNTRLVLHSEDCHHTDPRLEFVLKGDYLFHTQSGKCVHPLGGQKKPANDTRLVLYNKCGSDVSDVASFVQLPSGHIQHVSSGKCIHPKGGRAQPKDNTRLVLYDGCKAQHARFSIKPIRKIAKSTKLYHSYSGKCVHPRGMSAVPDNNTELVFHENYCDSDNDKLYFEMQSNGSIKHLSSGKCIHPYGGWDVPGNNTKLILYNDCLSYGAKFKHLTNGAIQHQSSKKCIHPYTQFCDASWCRNKNTKEITPINNTTLVLREHCKVGDKARMNFH